MENLGVESGEKKGQGYGGGGEDEEKGTTRTRHLGEKTELASSPKTLKGKIV